MGRAQMSPSAPRLLAWLRVAGTGSKLEGFGVCQVTATQQPKRAAGCKALLELAQLCTSPLDYQNVEKRALGDALTPIQVPQECPSSSQSHV